MKVINATHHAENGRTIVTLRFKTKDQLLNPDDPSPLPERELTQDAEDAILNNLFAHTLRNHITLEIQVPDISGLTAATEISHAVRHHFRFVLTGHERDTAIFIRERRTALVFTGINFLIALFYLGYGYQHPDWNTTIAGTFIWAFVVIINWATVWDTYEFFIFDSREKNQRKKLLNKIIDGEIRVVSVAQGK
jgi:hypothetical protein